MRVSARLVMELSVIFMGWMVLRKLQYANENGCRMQPVQHMVWHGIAETCF